MALQLDVLLDSPSIASIKEALEMLPKTLDSFYDRALLDIREPHQRLAAAAIQWLASSARPLSLSELAEAIVIRPGDDPSFNPDERLTDEFQILKFLPAGLVRKVFRKQPETDGRRLPHETRRRSAYCRSHLIACALRILESICGRSLQAFDRNRHSPPDCLCHDG